MSHGPSQFTNQRAESRKFVARISNTQAVLRRPVTSSQKPPPASRGWLLLPMRLPAQGRRDLPIRSSPTGGNGSFCRPSRLVSRLHSRPRLRFSGQVLRWAGVPDPFIVDSVAVQVCLEPRSGCCRGTGRALAPPAPLSPTPRTSPSLLDATEVRSLFHEHPIDGLQSLALG